MAFDFSNVVANINDAQYPNPFKNNPNLVGPFGGETVGFAKGVGELYSRNFYGGPGTLADAATVAKGMASAKLANSIGNKYALFRQCKQSFNGWDTGSKRVITKDHKLF